jgi:hypothetical protein
MEASVHFFRDRGMTSMSMGRGQEPVLEVDAAGTAFPFPLPESRTSLVLLPMLASAIPKMHNAARQVPHQQRSEDDVIHCGHLA